MTRPTHSDASTATETSAHRASDESGRLLRTLATGVPGLDAVLGGGIPEFSFNMLAGGPGAGKTTLAQQILFANATVERPALYFTVLGEPAVKMLRYQQQFEFFRPELVGSAVHYLNLSEEVLTGDLGAVLDRMTSEVERLQPGIVVVDSFRTIRSGLGLDPVAEDDTEGTRRSMALEQFVQRLALHLTSWEVTSLLIGEYDEPEQRQPLFTIADGIIWLTQVTDRNSVVRKLQAIKVRGQAQMPGLHTFRIGDDGLQVFPRIPEQQENRQRHEPSDVRLPTGVPGLDALMGGGIPAGDAVLLAGPTGTGKSTFAMQFAADGLRRGEAVVVVVFEEYPEAYLARLRTFDLDPDAMIAGNKLRIRYLRPLDLSVDETLADIVSSVKETAATRVVIDSLTGFEVALAPAFREDFRESLYRLVGALTATQITVFMTLEAVAMSTDAGFTGERVSFITDDIIVLRYVELRSSLQKIVAVAKMRRSKHSQQFWQYAIHESGAAIGEPLAGYEEILTGNPQRIHGESTAVHPGLTRQESAVLDALVRVGEAPLDALATSVGAGRAEIASHIERLVALDYAVRLAGEKGASDTYRAVARGVSP
ncbi:MAG: protein kinase [Gemmatimonadetes bacterium]|nr:protein kinase [Gemmatimonadota bacterium]